MDFKSHLKLILRHLLPITAVTAITILCALFFGKNFLATGYDATIFTTITVIRDNTSSNLSTSYDDVRAADHFTETVQGWFKNPAFLKSIRESELKQYNLTPDGDFTISAERQEKQNLVINFHVNEQDRVENISGKALSVLESAIQKYNRTSETDFAIASHETYSSESASKLHFLILFALILGLCIGIGLSYLYEYLTGKILSPLHAENTLNRKAAEIISFNFYHTDNFKYLNAFLEKLHSKKYLLIFTWYVSTKHQNKTIDRLKKKDIHTVNFIKTPENITSESNRLPILFVKPGKTGYQDLFRIKALLPENYLLVIQE